MTSTELKAEQIKLLESILAKTKRPCGLRAAIIGMIFPEFDAILTDLSKLGGITENHKP